MSLHYVHKSADIGGNGRYRYSLTRTWDAALPVALFVGLNPSVADGMIDDPTIRREVAFAQSWGCGSLEKANLYPYRATDPKDMERAYHEGIDIASWDTNRTSIAIAAQRATIIVAAWGAHWLAIQQQNKVLALLTDARDVFTLGQNKDGSPKHPLYLAKTTPRSLTWPRRPPPAPAQDRKEGGNG